VLGHAAAYGAALRLGALFIAGGERIAALWPPSGLQLAGLLVTERRARPLLVAAIFAVCVSGNLLIGNPMARSLALGAINCSEGVLAAWLIERFHGDFFDLGSFRQVVVLSLAGPCVACGLSALLSALLTRSSGSEFYEHVQTWWIADSVGILVVTPVLITAHRALGRPRAGWPSPLRWLEGLVLGGALLAGNMLVFFAAHPGAPRARLFHPYLLFPLLLWAAGRFGPLGASLATLLISASTLAGTHLSRGLFGDLGEAATTRLLGQQVFMAIVALVSLGLSAAIAEQRRTECELRAAKEAAEHAERMKSEFLDIASHELRTPLTSMSLLLQRALRCYDRGEPLERTTFERMRRQLERLVTMVDDLLDTARLERGTFSMERAPHELCPLVEGIVETFREIAPGREFTLRLPAERVLVDVDRGRIEQVLTNLLDNALKYSPAGSPIDVALLLGGGAASISVSDRGPGITPDQQRDLFTRFYRAGMVGRGKPPGLGLGLYVCREIVERHGGRIWVDSAGTAGCTFAFALPRIDEA
jgi:signal transduction histidine kinase